jgi:hypothetical protein
MQIGNSAGIVISQWEGPHFAGANAVAREMWRVRPREHDARSLFLPKFSVS